MSSTETTPADTDQPEAKGWDALDTAGLIAAVLLVVIVADIATDGRIVSRRLRPRPQEVHDDNVQADS